MANTEPAKYLIDALRKLRGDPSVTYPTADLDHKQVERVFSVARGSTPQAYLTVEGQGLYAGTKLVQQQIVGGDHQYVEVYQRWNNLPGEPVVSLSLNGRGELVTTTVTDVQTGSVAVTAGLGVEANSVQAKSAVEAVHSRSVATRETFTDRDRDGSLAMGGRVDIIRTRIAPGAAEDAVPATDPAGVLKVQVQQLATGEKERVVTQLASGQTQPVRVEWQRDNRVGFNIKVTKQNVAKSVVDALPSSGPVQTDNVLTEYQPNMQDENFYVKIVSTFPAQSTLDTLTRTYPVTVSYSFPDLLREAKILVPYIVSTDLSVVDYDVALRLKIDQGQRGQFNGTVTEYYTYDPDATIAALAEANKEVTVISPRADLLPGIFWQYSTSTASVSLRNFTIPATLRNAQTITGVTYEYDSGGDLQEVALTGDNSPSVAIEASTPSLGDFLAMAELVVDIDVQPYVAGMFVVKVIKVENPHFGT